MSAASPHYPRWFASIAWQDIARLAVAALHVALVVEVYHLVQASLIRGARCLAPAAVRCSPRPEGTLWRVRQTSCPLTPSCSRYFAACRSIAFYCSKTLIPCPLYPCSSQRRPPPGHATVDITPSLRYASACRVEIPADATKDGRAPWMNRYLNRTRDTYFLP